MKLKEKVEYNRRTYNRRPYNRRFGQAKTSINVAEGINRQKNIRFSENNQIGVLWPFRGLPSVPTIPVLTFRQP